VPLPTLVNTYQYNVNQTITALGSALACNRRILRLAKDSFKGFGTNPWTCKGSGDGAGSAAMDNVDRWAADANLIWANAGTAHSWIVLAQTQIHANFQICIDLTNAAGNGNVLTYVVSPVTGFSGGSNTARPTAADEMVLKSNAAWGGVFSSNVQSILHVQQATNGKATRLMVFSGGHLTTWWLFDKSSSFLASWTNPSASMLEASASITTDCPTYARMWQGANTYGRGNTGVSMTMYCSGEGYNNQALGVAQTAQHSYESAYPFPRVGLVSEIAANLGPMGRIDDLWWAYDNVPEGDTYPAGTARQFVNAGCFIVPHDGSVLATS
jgi:hypothetical protein